MQVRDILQRYYERYPDESERLKNSTQFLEDLSNPCSRSNGEGHVTGSGIVIQDEKILLIKHRYIQEWFQPGGHIDEDETPLMAAIRELEEETGWQTESIGDEIPLDIDVHLIPENVKKQEAQHVHVDFAYLLRPLRQVVASDAEPHAWFDLKSITAPRLKRVIEKYHQVDGT